MADLSQIAKAIQKVAASTPGIVTGTVSDGSDSGQMQIILDSDPSRKPVSALSLVGTGAVTGARVLAIRYPPRGLVVLGFLNLPTPTIVQRYFVPGTWTKPEGLRGVWVELQSAGGGSGGCAATVAGNTSSAGGGQGGGYAKFWVPEIDLPASVAVGVGLGGNGGAIGATGTAGSASSFGTIGSVNGGNPGSGGGSAAFTGISTSQNGGTGNQLFTGTASNPIVVQADDGGEGIRFSTPSGNPTCVPGYGGGSFFSGIQRVGAISGGQIAGTSGWFAGGGASAPANFLAAGNTGQTGNSGSDGVVYVTEIYY